MNFLAHAHLSFAKPGILVGNMISDFVKGKKQYDYPPEIQAGIKLHRAIDKFTDNHSYSRRLKSYFAPVYRLYGGAFGDVVYDHFLALDPYEFSDPEVLKDFTTVTYKILDDHYEILPPVFQKMLPYMTAQDWLFNYRFRSGIERSFEGLVKRARYLTESKQAFRIFNLHYDAMQECYTGFYPLLKMFTVHQLELLPNA